MNKVTLGKNQLGINIDSNDLPVGSVVSFDGEKIPAGFLECDGSEFDPREYPKLAKILGCNVLPTEETLAAGANIYDKMVNKPSINNVVLEGDKSLEDLNIVNIDDNSIIELFN